MFNLYYTGKELRFLSLAKKKKYKWMKIYIVKETGDKFLFFFFLLKEL